MAQPFDANSLKLTGDAVPLEENVLFNKSMELGAFSVSQNGILFYQKSKVQGGQFAWFDRKGKLINTFSNPGNYLDAVLSPDETKIAATIRDEAAKNIDIWIYDLTRDIKTRFTFSDANDGNPVWSPDNKWIVFKSNRNNNYDIFIKSVNGIGNAIQLTNLGNNIELVDWSPDGKFISFSQYNSETNDDICLLPVSNPQDTNKRKAIPFINSQFGDDQAHFSPDNKWISYISNESGEIQLYVRSLSSPGEKWQISTTNPGFGYNGWSASGKELYYKGEDDKIYSVGVSSNGKK